MSYLESSISELGKNWGKNGFPKVEVAHNVRLCSKTGKSINISYNAFGDRKSEAIVFIPGTNCQGTTYPTPVCQWLANQGYYVLRIDNRDTGLSSSFNDVKYNLNFMHLMLPKVLLSYKKIPYHLEDFSDDAVAFLHHLGIKKAHWIGSSMGGMIVQLIAIRNPSCCITVTLMSTCSNMNLYPPSIFTLIGFLYKPKSSKLEDVKEYRRWFSQKYLYGKQIEDIKEIDIMTEEIMEHGVILPNEPRHEAAVMLSESKDELLQIIDKNIKVLIVHGSKDKIIPVKNGFHLHSIIKNSELAVFPHLGHFASLGESEDVYKRVLQHLKC